MDRAIRDPTTAREVLDDVRFVTVARDDPLASQLLDELQAEYGARYGRSAARSTAGVVTASPSWPNWVALYLAMGYPLVARGRHWFTSLLEDIQGRLNAVMNPPLLHGRLPGGRTGSLG